MAYSDLYVESIKNLLKGARDSVFDELNMILADKTYDRNAERRKTYLTQLLISIDAFVPPNGENK